MEREKVTKATFRIAERNWWKFRSYCVAEGRDTSDVCRELVNRYIKERENKNPQAD